MIHSNHSNIIFSNQEYYGWLGNFIFITAQISQVIHTYKVKRTRDISYILQVLLLIGNLMYTTFGYLDNSFSMFVGNLVTVFTSLIQISQKIYYDKKYRNYEGIYDSINF